MTTTFLCIILHLHPAYGQVLYQRVARKEVHCSMNCTWIVITYQTSIILVEIQTKKFHTISSCRMTNQYIYITQNFEISNFQICCTQNGSCQYHFDSSRVDSPLHFLMTFLKNCWDSLKCSELQPS